MPPITNIGTVTKIKKNKVVVKIEAKSSCAHCEIKDSCYMQNCNAKMIEVYTDKAKGFSIGEKVTVYMDNSAAWKTVFFAYILPLILVLVTLVTGILWGNEEIVAAIYSLLILIPYYLILYISKVWIRDKIKFGIEKME